MSKTAVKHGKKRKGSQHSHNLSKTQEHRLRFALRRIACSETWVDAQIKSFDSKTVTMRVFDPHVFPPGGKAKTKMRWCRSCGRYTPGHCIHLIEQSAGRMGFIFSATLQCDDCRISETEDRYRELYEAGLHLRPGGSQSLVERANLRARMRF